MGVLDDVTVNECGSCDGRCFDPKACPISNASSDHDAMLFCTDCLTECPKCGESVCADHWSETRKTCDACENQRYVASGEARDDYMRYGRDDS